MLMCSSLLLCTPRLLRDLQVYRINSAQPSSRLAQVSTEMDVLEAAAGSTGALDSPVLVLVLVLVLGLGLELTLVLLLPVLLLLLALALVLVPALAAFTRLASFSGATAPPPPPSLQPLLLAT